MEHSFGTLVFFLLCTIRFSLSQPTVQHSLWRSPESSRCNNDQRGSQGNVGLSGPSGLTSLQNSVDMILLDLERHAVDTESLKQEVQSLQGRHEESTRLLLQLTESVNILVKRLVKTPACDCSSADGGGQLGGRGGRERKGDVNGRGFQQEDSDLKEDLELLDASGRLPGDTTGKHSDNDEQVLMDQKGKNTSPRLHPASNTRRDHESEMPRDLGVNQSRAEIGSQDGDPSVVPGTSATTTTRTTTTADPILRMYNGSVPKDCDDIRALGYATNGTYVIKPSTASRSVVVLCEFHVTDVWTLIQRRLDGSQDFYRSWNDYKRGFGDLRGEFWIGNEVLHQLTTQDFYRLKIDMWEWPRSVSQSEEPVSRYYFAESRHFYIDSEAERYRLHVPNDYFAYRGVGGSGLRIHAGPFLTNDVDDLPPGMRENCAQLFHCGWWFTTCVRNANFNGRYYKGGYANVEGKERARDDIYWPNIDQSLYRVVMKVGRVSERYALGA